MEVDVGDEPAHPDLPGVEERLPEHLAADAGAPVRWVDDEGHVGDPIRPAVQPQQAEPLGASAGDQGDDALDGVTPGEDEEDEETDEDEGIPFGIQEDVECFLLHARGKKTLKSYERAIKLLLAWCERHKNEDLIKEVTKMDDEVFQFDYKKLA